MHYSYQSITGAATEAIEAMAREIYSASVSDAGLLVSLAAGVYWAWMTMVGETARQCDADRMILAISVLQERRKLVTLSSMTNRRK